MRYLPSSYLSLPEKPGVYLYKDKKGLILYVGKAKNLKARVSSYFTNTKLLGEKTRVLVTQIQSIETVEVESELESLLLEAFYIKKFAPRYNIRMTDGKSYPLIRINMHEKYPTILFARRPDDKKSIYFGPYPSAGSVKLVLKTIRRVFPFVSVQHHLKRVCLYHHLHLCPCPPVFDSLALQKEYKKIIGNIIRILEGESPKVMKALKKERDRASSHDNFEQAAQSQKQIQALSYITQSFHRPFEYDTNPNLRADIREKELTELRLILNHNGYQIDNPLYKIECYDISHIQGAHTTASMVVFLNGEKEGSLYRRFKIRLDKTPDDFASMREVLTRRFKHIEWEYPDLIIVDGGKGQVSAALDEFTRNNITIPLIGLAKRIETIVIPLHHPLIIEGHQQASGTEEGNHTTIVYKNDHFQEVVLPHSVSAIKLLQRIRDEAHRFAITYHRTLRSKRAITKI